MTTEIDLDYRPTNFLGPEHFKLCEMLFRICGHQQRQEVRLDVLNSITNYLIYIDII